MADKTGFPLPFAAAGDRQLLEALFRRQTETITLLTRLMQRMDALEKARSKEETK